jgi:hypothetical protein
MELAIFLRWTSIFPWNTGGHTFANSLKYFTLKTFVVKDSYYKNFINNVLRMLKNIIIADF